MKKTVYKILKIIFACLYSLLSAFWIFVFVEEAIWDSSAIGMDGVYYFERIDLLSALLCFYLLLLLSCDILTAYCPGG